VFTWPARLKSLKFSLDQMFTVLAVFQNNGFKWVSVALRFCSKQSPEICPSDLHLAAKPCHATTVWNYPMETDPNEAT
jgi:hypothetical protein